MKRSGLILSVIALAAAALAAWTVVGCWDGPMADRPAEQKLEAAPAAAPPGVRIRQVDGHVTRMYGRAMASGANARISAEAFIAQHAQRFGVSPDELSPADALRYGALPPPAHEQPVMYDRARGRYRFTLMRYGQQKGGIPVFRARLGLLVRNDADFSLVSATSSLRKLAGFVPRVGRKRIRADLANKAAQEAAERTDFKGQAIRSTAVELTNFTEPELVIWAGLNDRVAEPRVAVTYVGDNYGDQGATRPERWLFVADAETGEILHKESLIIFTAVGGNVSGNATEGPKAMQCSPEVLTAFPLAEASIDGGASAFADENGDFTIPNPGTSAVTVRSLIGGERFDVFNYSGADEELFQTDVPSASFDFIHNESNTEEFVIAQSNGYAQANEVRDWVLQYNPAFPVVSTQYNFPVYVNRTDGYCPGNAWYDYASINFCIADAGYGNTAFASVLQHEYGHHLVASGGSGQDEYGEGMSDCVAMLIADDPGLGYGFYYDQCNTPLRSADNDCQYSATTCTENCGSAVHACGRLLSGAVWSVRNELVVTEPADYLDILSNLTVNSILLHSGTAIDAQIAIDFLTLDDDDSNIGNGTPHRTEICTGFEAHGLDCPPLEEGLSVSPSTGFTSSGDQGGPFTPDSTSYTVENLGPGSIDYVVSADVSWLTITDGSGTLALGETADVTVAINSGADSLPQGEYTGTVSFTNTTDHAGDTTREVSLHIGFALRHAWTMDSDPGWTTEGAWAWGQPQGLGGDPSSGYTGDNVYGYNLSGTYPNGLPETHLTSTPINCEGLTGVSLKFWRWLGVESSTWDHAYVRVSNDGTTWTTVWSHSGSTLIDTTWILQEFDISAVADNQPNVYLRWTMGSTDGSVVYCGWNIDDVEIWAFGGGPTECDVPEDCDDDLYCNGAEDCVAQECVDGTPVSCPADSVACTVEACDEASDACTSTPDHASCADASVCNGIEVCDPVLDCQPGTPLDCDDAIACTDDSCVEPSGCANTPDDALCDDGLYCDGAETCNVSAGCQPGTDPCPGQDCDEASDTCMEPCFCEEYTSTLDQHVSAGRAYTESVLCDTRYYATGTGEELGSNNGGTEVTLYESPEGYFSTEECDCGCSDDADCDDGVFCNGDETCVARECQAGAPPDCDDEQFCTGTETCDAGTDACQSSGDPCPSGEICDEAGDVCLECTDDAHCDDGLYCNGQETCVANVCQPGTPVVCDDGVACTVDTCNEGTDACDNAPNHAACDNGLFCDGAESCHVTAGCQPGTEPCGPMGCDETNDLCAECSDDSHCNNDVFCDGAESCVDMLCQSGTPPTCDDAVACTADACNAATDACENTPDNAACDNGLFCDGQETCDAIVGCQPGTDPCGPMGCHEGDDRCAECTDDSHCDNGVFCDGAESCVDMACQSGAPPSCDDGVACTADACDADTDACESTPDNAACDDGNDCTADTCDAAGCSYETLPDCCGNTACEAGEDQCTCSQDCGAPPSQEADCADGIDNDCDGATDGADSDCVTCVPDGDYCSSDAECCSGDCRGFWFWRWCG